MIPAFATTTSTRPYASNSRPNHCLAGRSLRDVPDNGLDRSAIASEFVAESKKQTGLDILKDKRRAFAGEFGCRSPPNSKS